METSYDSKPGFSKTTVNGTERDYFLGVGADGEYVNVIVHPVECNVASSEEISVAGIQR